MAPPAELAAVGGMVTAQLALSDGAASKMGLVKCHSEMVLTSSLFLWSSVLGPNCASFRREWDLYNQA